MITPEERERLIQKRLDLVHCEHGVTGRDLRQYEGTVWAAPFDHCDCCGMTFPYVDSSSMSSAGKWSSRSWTKGLCKQCGGHYVQRSGMDSWMSEPTNE